MPHAVLEKPKETVPDVLPDLRASENDQSVPEVPVGNRALIAAILLLTFTIFAVDVGNPENRHIGVLYNVCIALTLWSWRSRWVVGTTVATVALRLIGYAYQTTQASKSLGQTELINLLLGLAVQVFTGALIWRQVVVQHRLEAGERRTLTQARDLEAALSRTQCAVEEAQEATRRERESRLREVEARLREKKSMQALERVRNLSAALSRAVLPVVPPEIAGGRMRLAARYAPAERDIQIGGDFYDVIALDETQNCYALVIGDVAGHGVEAAAQTALVTSTLRTCALEGGEGPAGVLSRTARTLEGQLESFVSLFYGVYDADAQTLTYACAGHEPPLLADPIGGPPAALRPTGPILGVGVSDFDEITLALPPGGTLVFVTDGLTEVRRASGEMLEWEGLAEIVARQSALTDDVACLADRLLDEVRGWADRPHLVDDVALLVARVGHYDSGPASVV
jgi:serine phosphatase RsbU (regulator of sigma subunit)